MAVRHTAANMWLSQLHGPWITAWREDGRMGRLTRQAGKDEDHLVSAIQSPVSEGSNLCVPSTCLKAANVAACLGADVHGSTVVAVIAGHFMRGGPTALVIGVRRSRERPASSAAVHHVRHGANGSAAGPARTPAG